MESLGLSEIILQLQVENSALLPFTSATRGARAILQPLAYDPDRFPQKFLMTIQAPREAYESVLPALRERYPEFRVVRKEEKVLTAVMGFGANGRFEEQKRPYRDVLRLFGPDMFLRPIVIQDGWVTVGIVIPSDVDAGAIVRDINVSLRQQGSQVKLVRVGEYRPENHPMGDYDDSLTGKQLEILKMALSMGLYDSPRRCTLDDLSTLFGISKAAAHNRLKSAERKILGLYFGE